MGTNLAQIAAALECDERTVRRYANEGLIRGERRSKQELRLPFGEERYLRGHWALLSGLRRALRTESRVRLAVLFGSTAIGDDLPGSDVDLLIDHSTGDLEQVVELRRRLEKRVGRPIHVVLLEDAERSPLLLADVLLEGRVIADRGDAWTQLSRRGKRIARQASKEEEATGAAAGQAIAEARRRLGDR